MPTYLHRLPYYPAVDQKGIPFRSPPAVCALARLAHTRFAHRRMIDTPRAHRGRRAASRITPPLSGYGLFLRASTREVVSSLCHLLAEPHQTQCTDLTAAHSPRNRSRAQSAVLVLCSATVSDTGLCHVATRRFACGSLSSAVACGLTSAESPSGLSAGKS